MNRLQAMAKIMMLLNKDGLLKPGGSVYKIIRKNMSDRIDRLGPDAALLNVIERQPQILDQIKVLAMWHKTTRFRPKIEF